MIEIRPKKSVAKRGLTNRANVHTPISAAIRHRFIANKINKTN